MKIYLVLATNGKEYSDYSERNIAAYSDKNIAQQHVDLANKWIAENRKGKYYHDDSFKEQVPIYDKNLPYWEYSEYMITEIEYLCSIQDYHDHFPIKVN